MLLNSDARKTMDNGFFNLGGGRVDERTSLETKEPFFNRRRNDGAFCISTTGAQALRSSKKGAYIVMLFTPPLFLKH